MGAAVIRDASSSLPLLPELPVIWPTGYRKTRQREVVIAALREAAGEVDVPQLVRLVHEREARLSPSTVYRTIAELRHRGLIDALRLTDPVAGRHGVPASLRMTQQRTAILDVLREAAAAREPLDVDELHRRARGRSPRLCRSTVSQLLAALHASGEVPSLLRFDPEASAARGARSIEGHRWTRQRRLVQHVVEEVTPPLTVEEVHRRVRQHDPEVSRATVVRALTFLQEHGSVRAGVVVDIDRPFRGAGSRTHRGSRHWTRQQQVVLDVLLAARQPLAVRQLQRRAHWRDARVGVAHVYQVIAALQQRGLVEVVPNEDGEYRYACSPEATADGRGRLVCRSCGLAIAVASPLLARAQLDLQLRHAFRLTRAEFELRALCDACAAAGRRIAPDTARA